MVRIGRALPVIFHKVPKQRIELSAGPLYGIAVLVDRHENAVGADGVEVILFFLFIPVAGVHDDPGAVGDGRIRNADLAGGVGQKIIVGQLRRIHKVQPLSATAAADAEGPYRFFPAAFFSAFSAMPFHRSVVCQRGASAFQANLIRVDAGPRDHLDLTVLIGIGYHGQAVCINSQIPCASVNRSFQIVVIVVDPFEGPHGDFAFVGHVQLHLIAGGTHDREGFRFEGIFHFLDGIRQHRLAGHAAAPVHQAVGVAVKLIGIAGNFSVVPEVELRVFIICACPCRKRSSPCASLHIPVITITAPQSEDARTVARFNRKDGCRSRIGCKVKAVRSLNDIFLGFAILAINLILIVSLASLKPILDCFGACGRALGRFGLGNTRTGIVNLCDTACQIIAVSVADIQTIGIEIAQVPKRINLSPAKRYCRRPFHDRVSRKAFGRKADYCAIHNHILHYVRLIRIIGKMDNHRVFCRFLTGVFICQLDPYVYLAAICRLDLLSVFIDDLNIKQPEIPRAAFFQTQCIFGISYILLIAHAIHRGRIGIGIILCRNLRNRQISALRYLCLRPVRHRYFIVMSVRCQYILFNRGSDDSINREALGVQGDGVALHQGALHQGASFRILHVDHLGLCRPLQESRLDRDLHEGLVLRLELLSLGVRKGDIYCLDLGAVLLHAGGLDGGIGIVLRIDLSDRQPDVLREGVLGEAGRDGDPVPAVRGGGGELSGELKFHGLIHRYLYLFQKGQLLLMQDLSINGLFRSRLFRGELFCGGLGRFLPAGDRLLDRLRRGGIRGRLLRLRVGCILRIIRILFFHDGQDNLAVAPLHGDGNSVIGVQVDLRLYLEIDLLLGLHFLSGILRLGGIPLLG